MRTSDISSDWHGAEMLFVDQHREEESKGSAVTNPQLDRCVFENIRLKGLRISQGKITHTRFRNCYLRNTTFEQVDLTGCEFVNCNMRNVQFRNCFLDYARFRDCVMPYNIVSDCNFRYPSSHKEVLQQVRFHAQTDGASREARRLQLELLKLDRIHEWNKAFGDAEYYRDRFKGWSRVSAFLRWMAHWVERIGWGYGLRPVQLLVVAAIVVLLFAVGITASNSIYRVPEHSLADAHVIRALNFPEAVYLVLVTFSTLGYGDITPASDSARVWSAAICSLGAVFIGLIAASLFKRMER